MPNRMRFPFRGLPGEPQRELNLARIEDGPRSAIVRVRRALPEIGSWTADPNSPRRAEVGGCIRCVVEPDVHSVKGVECLGESLQAGTLCELESARHSEIDTLKTISFESIARLDAYAIITGEPISVRIQAGEFREVVR